MGDSATGLRERRTQRTAHDLSAAARRLTARSGLSGFTVEELCDEVGVSRRTFFNYFASKEHAVLGRSLRRDDGEALDAFLAGGERRAGRVSPSLLEDLAALHVARWAGLDITRETFAQMRETLEREPRLHARLVEMLQEDERADAALVARREGLPADDPLASTAVHLIGALGRASAWEYLESCHDGAPTATFADILTGRLAAARTLLGT